MWKQSLLQWWNMCEWNQWISLHLCSRIQLYTLPKWFDYISKEFREQRLLVFISKKVLSYSNTYANLCCKMFQNIIKLHQKLISSDIFFRNRRMWKQPMLKWSNLHEWNQWISLHMCTRLQLHSLSKW